MIKEASGRHGKKNLITCVVHAEQKGAGDGEGEDPDHRDHHGDAAFGAVARVVQQWHSDGGVPAIAVQWKVKKDGPCNNLFKMNPLTINSRGRWSCFCSTQPTTTVITEACFMPIHKHNYSYHNRFVSYRGHKLVMTPHTL